MSRRLAALLMLAAALPVFGQVFITVRRAAAGGTPPASIALWLNFDAEATSSPDTYGLDGTKEHSDGDTTGTFAEADGLSTLADTSFGSVNALDFDMGAADTTDTLMYLEFDGDSIWDNDSGSIGCLTKLVTDAGGAESPRLFEFITSASSFLRVIHDDSDSFWIDITGTANFNFVGTVPLTTFDDAGEHVLWQVSYDFTGDVYEVFINGVLDACANNGGTGGCSDVGDKATFLGSAPKMRFGNTQGAVGSAQYRHYNCVYSTDPDYDMFEDVCNDVAACTGGIKDYDGF